MKTGLRFRLFGASLAMVILVGVPASIVLEGKLRGWVQDQVIDELSTEARAIHVALPQYRQTQLQEAADAYGEALGVRVTILNKHGIVVGDSAVIESARTSVTRHNEHPELRQASQTGHGVAQRRSEALQSDQLYVAVKRHEYIIRLATPLTQVDAAVYQLRILLGISAMIFLAAGIILSWLASALASRRLRPLVSGAGSFSRVTTELERTVSLLERERDRFQTALERLEEGVLAVNGDRRITLINPAAMSLLGLRDSPVGQLISDASQSPEIVELARMGSVTPCEREFRLDSPRPRQVLAKACPLQSGRGVVFSLHDMTDLRKLETMRRDFVTNVSHELRTPVSIIMANAETLLNGAIEDTVRGPMFLEAIHRQTDRLGRLISDLLELSRIEAGQFPIHLQTVALEAVVTRALESLTTSASEKGQSLKQCFTDPMYVVADVQALEHVVMNLVDNAIKYCPAGASIEVSSDVRGQVVRVSISDDGPGIAERHRPRVFERFYRVDKGRARNMGGTGLGLSIVKHIIDSMGGRVGVAPNHPEGSIFWFELKHARASGSESETNASILPADV